MTREGYAMGKSRERGGKKTGSQVKEKEPIKGGGETRLMLGLSCGHVFWSQRMRGRVAEKRRKESEKNHTVKGTKNAAL